MTPKKNRPSTRTIKKIFAEGRFLSTPHFTFKFILTNSPNPPQVSFIAPKSVAKHAVKRNFLRRLGYAALKNHTRKLPKGILGAFVFKRYEENVSQIEDEIKKVIDKMH
jgi:ribonuclease P protein component